MKRLRIVCLRYKVKVIGVWRTMPGNRDILINHPPKKEEEFENEVRKTISNADNIMYQTRPVDSPSSDKNYCF